MRQIALAVLFMFLSVSCVRAEGLFLDGFEGPVTGGAEGTVDYGAGQGSKVEVSASSEIKHSGEQSLKVTFDAVSNGYLWVARGFGLDAKNTAWQVRPDTIDWSAYSGISFYMCGTDSKTSVAFDMKDNGYEMWRIMIEDNFTGWKKIECPFASFFARGDWQPDDADKNGVFDFPVWSFQFEPRPIAKGTLYFDDVELIKK